MNSNYVINLVINGKKIPYATADLMTIDNITTKFDDMEQFIKYIKNISHIDNDIDEIILTHPYTFTDKGEKITVDAKEPLIFNDRESLIIEHRSSIVNKIITFLSHYSNLVWLSKQNLGNKYLQDFLNKLLDKNNKTDREYQNYYQWQLMALERDLNNSYKHIRDLAINIDNYYVNARLINPEYNIFFLKSEHKSFDYSDINQSFKDLNITYEKPSQKKYIIVENSPYQSAISKLNIEKLSKNVDIDELFSIYDLDDPKIQNMGIFDGTIDPKDRGKSR